MNPASKHAREGFGMVDPPMACRQNALRFLSFYLPHLHAMSVFGDDGSR